MRVPGMLCLSLWVAIFIGAVNGFVPLSSRIPSRVSRPSQRSIITVLPSGGPVGSQWSRREWVLCATPQNDDDDDEEEGTNKENPYQDPNYPDLEFVDYSDPNYNVDQGVTDEFYDAASIRANTDDTEERIEEMREERRRRNDEYQFETYFADILKQGDEYKGEWTVYKTSTFMPMAESKKLDPNGLPRLVKAGRTLRVISSGYKVDVPTESNWRVDGERICHKERAVTDGESDPYKSWQEDIDTDEGFGRHASQQQEDSSPSLTAEAKQTEEEIMANMYWPEQMSSADFRGQQGNMCVGAAYTICSSVPFANNVGVPYEGPFEELRTELGIQSNMMRYRIKLDYSVKDAEKEAFLKTNNVPPPLHLKSMTVCRETREMWPRVGKYRSAADRMVSDSLFGQPGAEGGLYDPPPVGTEEQAGRYMMLDLEGAASVLFPHMMDQDPEAFDGNGWVTSLDWMPGKFRYQVDRKVHSGKGIMGLRTLELSEVQGVDAEQYRPRDGGQDMRQ